MRRGAGTAIPGTAAAGAGVAAAIESGRGDADTVDDYLNGGNATALCVDDLTNGFHIRGRSRRASLRQIVHSLRSSGGSAHVVVRGNRERPEQFANTPHVFVIAFIGGTPYIIDASLHEVTELLAFVIFRLV
jgi:hypothetical protein